MYCGNVSGRLGEFESWNHLLLELLLISLPSAAEKSLVSSETDRALYVNLFKMNI